ncbi:MAG: hypothetical protein U1D30_19945 [Planctomycetota bacterium]
MWQINRALPVAAFNFFTGVVVVAFTCASTAWSDTLARLQPEQLKKTHAAVTEYQQKRRPVELATGFRDYRACLHVHSGLSHDSKSSLDEVIAGAKKANVQVLMFNEHPAASYDYVTDGHQGIRDGVLLIPGAETNGFLAFPKTSVQRLGFSSPQEFVDLVKRTGGLIFLSHLEVRFTWSFHQMTGAEIYNSHADATDEWWLLGSLPKKAVELASVIEEFPQEVYSAIHDYPKFYLRRFDELCRMRPHTGVAANDAHHNIVFTARLGEKGQVFIEDSSGDKVYTFPPGPVPELETRSQGKKAGESIVTLDIDPYPVSLKHVSTHLLMNELTSPAVWEALEKGRAYVSFDWIADPTGFACLVEDSDGVHGMGDEVLWNEDIRLKVECALPGHIRIVRDGAVVAEERNHAVAYEVPGPGIYRVEVWLEVAGRRSPGYWRTPSTFDPRLSARNS